MFVDTFTVRYLQNQVMKDSQDGDDSGSSSAVPGPVVSIFTGIILLICSIALIVTKGPAIFGIAMGVLTIIGCVYLAYRRFYKPRTDVNIRYDILQDESDYGTMGGI